MYTKKQSNTSKASINRYPKLEKSKDPPVPIVEVKDDTRETCMSSVYFPYIKEDNCSRLLPNYTTVLGRTAKLGVFVEDLDQLQHDIEKLLSFASVRNRLLREQLSTLSTASTSKDYQEKGAKKRKTVESPSSPATLKQIQLEHKRKLRLSKAGRRFIRGKGKGLSGLVGTCNFGNDTSIRHPRIIIPRNDMSARFWTSVEPFCQDITRDDTHFLDTVINDCSMPTTVHIPEVGGHYSLEWSDNTLSLEKHSSETLKQRKKVYSIFTDMYENGHNLVTNHAEITYDSTLSERILESVSDMSTMMKANGKAELSTLTSLSDENGHGQSGGGGVSGGRRVVAVCLEHRLRRDLFCDSTENQQCGPMHIQPFTPHNDDIILEIQRCCRELDSLNRHNIVELTKLREKCMNDLKRQSFKTALNKIDTQVLDLYGEITKAKQAHAATFTRPNLQTFEKRALDIRKQQIAVHKSYAALVPQTDQNTATACDEVIASDY